MPVAVVNTGTFNPPPAAFPDATTTGYINAPGYPGSLTDGSSLTIQSNHTYSYLSFNGGVNVGAAGSPVTNVTFIGCRMFGSGDGALALLYGDGITFSYCTFEPAVTTLPVSHTQGYQYGIEANGGFNTSVQALTVDHCNMYGFANCTDVSGSTVAKPQVFSNNYIHDARADGGVDHTDGIGMLNGAPALAGVRITGNSIQAVGNTNGVAYQSGPAGTYNQCTVTGNLFGGFGYTVNFSGGSAANFTFTGNTFSTLLLPAFGPIYGNSATFWTGGGNLWRNNKWHVPAGAAWGTPANDGLFWMPVVSAIPPGNSDAAYISVTDYTG